MTSVTGRRRPVPFRHRRSAHRWRDLAGTTMARSTMSAPSAESAGSTGSAESAATPAPRSAPEIPRMLGRGMTMGDQLARHARTIGEEVAVVFEGTSRTYRELDRRVSRLANALRDRGVGRRDRIAVLGLNTLEVLEAFFAATRLGAICVPVNFRLVAGEIAYVLEDSGAAAAVVHAPLAATYAQARQQLD